MVIFGCLLENLVPSQSSISLIKRESDLQVKLVSFFYQIQL